MSEGKSSRDYEVEIVQPKQGVWRTFDGTDGLPALIYCLFQDNKGYLWVGTIHGLFRYDGAKFVNYVIEKDNIKANIVHSICEDHQNRLWVGTEDGAFCYDGESFTRYAIENGLPSNLVRSIYMDSQHRLWFGTADCGISCYDGANFTNYAMKDGMADNFITSTYEDSKGRIWLCHASMVSARLAPVGISCFDGRKFTKYTQENGLAGNIVNAVCEDNKERVWFATHNGLSYYDGNRLISYTTDSGLPHDYVLSVRKDDQGNLWFGTWDGGVFYFNGENFTSYNTTDGLLENRVNDILQDQEGNFWFSHFNSGLSYFKPYTCQLLTDHTVSEALIQTKDSSIWFGEANRLYCLRNGHQQFRTYNTAVYSLIEDSKGHIWIGFLEDELCLYDSIGALWEMEPKRYGIKDGLIRNLVCSIIETKDGDIWIGMAHPGCICRFNNGKFDVYYTPNPAASRLLEDKQGRIWIGGGISYYDPNENDALSMQNYTTEHGLIDDMVTSIVEDNTGHLWLGTWHGLCSFDGENFVSYVEELWDRSTHQISAKDVNGQLWFGTLGNGIYRYDGKHFQQLSKADGLLSNSITGFVPQWDGSMIIGTYGGIVHYHPTAIVPPGIEIREVIADRIYAHPEILELTVTEADLVTISYQGISLSTHRMRYSYWLEGYSEKWRDTWDSQVRYEKLPPGEYTFHVIAINRDLVCSETPATIKLSIVPDPRDEKIARLESELERRNRELEAEMQDARDMQLSLLPNSAPELDGFEITGICHPANNIAGDFFTYIWLDDEKTRLGIVLMDVTGHGMKAATTTFLANGMLRSEVRSRRSPDEIMLRMHQALQDVLPQNAFVAMSFGVIDVQRKILTHLNAGQPAPILIRDGEAVELKIKSDVPLGLKVPAEYIGTSVQLASGDMLLFFSDGLTEAENPQRQMYDEVRIWEILDSLRAKPAQEWLDTVLGDVRDFVTPGAPDDDLTLVVLRVI